MSAEEIALDHASNRVNNSVSVRSSSRRTAMSDTDVRAKVLDVLSQESAPLGTRVLYEKLRDMDIDDGRARRAVVRLAVEHRIDVAPDLTVSRVPEPT
jgi:hypothetical protein